MPLIKHNCGGLCQYLHKKTEEQFSLLPDIQVYESAEMDIANGELVPIHFCPFCGHDFKRPFVNVYDNV